MSRRACASVSRISRQTRCTVSPKTLTLRHGEPALQEEEDFPGLTAPDGQDPALHQSLDFVRGADSDDPAPVDEADPVAALGLVEIGGGDQDRYPLLPEPVENAPEIPAAQRVDAVGRLVEQQDPGGVDEGADQLQFLLHAAGEVARPARQKRAHVAEVEQFIDTGCSGLFAARRRDRHRSRYFPAR